MEVLIVVASPFIAAFLVAGVRLLWTRPYALAALLVAFTTTRWGPNNPRRPLIEKLLRRDEQR